MLFDSIQLIKEREGDVQLIEKTSFWERGLHQKLAFLLLAAGKKRGSFNKLSGERER